MQVWLVLAGERHEGYEVRSIHTTYPEARGACDRLAENAPCYGEKWQRVLPQSDILGYQEQYIYKNVLYLGVQVMDVED